MKFHNPLHASTGALQCAYHNIYMNSAKFTVRRGLVKEEWFKIRHAVRHCVSSANITHQNKTAMQHKKQLDSL